MNRLSGVSRAFATKAAAKAGASHTPPIKIYGVAGKYAEAAYVAASKAGSLQQVENELSAFKSMLSSNASFVTYLENPSVSKDEKMSKINELMPADKFSDVTRNLLEVVSANSRISDVPKIITSFEELMNASKGVVKVVIMSADKLKAADVTAATKAVTGMLEKGQTAEVTTEVDPSIMGGLQVKIGDRFLDLSVQQRIADIGKSLDVAE